MLMAWKESPIKKSHFSGGNEDVEVNITGCINSGKAVEDACEDLTECSSSFGDTGSGIEIGSAFSDTEVESRMCAGSTCDECSEPRRIKKKKMTMHWRSFIGPLMWRCKWIELQLKKLQSQELKYDKELEAYNYKKQLEFSKFTVDDFDVKSVPISDGIHKHKVMKRKKRRRAEECDISSYMSSHTIFSYYENKDCTDGACLKDFPGVAKRGSADNDEDFKLNDVWQPTVDHEDNDKSLDDIIQKIEAAESQVQKLKNRIDKVVSETAGKFCSITQLSTAGSSDGFNQFDHNFASFPGSENTFPVNFLHTPSQLKSELYTEDLLMPGNTLPTHERITPLIETINRPQLEAPWENTKDEVLIQNQLVKDELHELENDTNQLVEEAKEPVEEQNAVNNVDSTLKVFSTSKSNFPRNTRRRRRPGLNGWRRRQSR